MSTRIYPCWLLHITSTMCAGIHISRGYTYYCDTGWRLVPLCFTGSFFLRSFFLREGHLWKCGYSVVTPTDMHLYFIDGTDSTWTASLCHWSFHCIRGWSFHQPNYWTPCRWLSRRGPSKTATSAHGTRWTRRRGVVLSCSRVRSGRTGGLKSEDLIFVLQALQSFKSTGISLQGKV